MFLIPQKIKRVIADILALVIYSFITGMIIEIFLSGMTFSQSLSSRLLSIPVNIVIAWPYGIYRDFLVLNSEKIYKHFLIKSFVDLFAYVSYQSPVYASILWFVGANEQQIITAVTSNAIISMVLGIIYGRFLDFCRYCLKA